MLHTICDNDLHRQISLGVLEKYSMIIKFQLKIVEYRYNMTDHASCQSVNIYQINNFS